MADNKVSEMLAGVSDSFKGMIDVNSVIGNPIVAGDGTMIVPISKVSFGFGGGGFEYDAKKNDARMDDKNFSGGMGGGASVEAEAFLVINGGSVRLIPMEGDSSAVSRIVDMMPVVIDKVNGFVANRREKKAAKKSGEENAQ